MYWSYKQFSLPKWKDSQEPLMDFLKTEKLRVCNLKTEFINFGYVSQEKSIFSIYFQKNKLNYFIQVQFPLIHLTI